MNAAKYRAWMFYRQGLERPGGSTAPEALARFGWSRSVGGANPYIALVARTSEGREAIDARAAAYDIYELPSARGCTYVLPAEHFALGLAAARGFASATEVATARKLGVTDAEIEALKEGVLGVLASGPMSPADMKVPLGALVRNLGEEGKKRGLTTILPLALGLLQVAGRIRRMPLSGRFDTQRYAYELWSPPLSDFPDESAMASELARLYFSWIGAATAKEFRDISGLGVKATQAAFVQASVVRFGEDTDLLCLPDALADFAAYATPERPVYRLASHLDNLLHLRRGTPYWVAEEDAQRPIPTSRGSSAAASLQELDSHPIFDRGRLIGLWEFDADAGKIVWTCWTPIDQALVAEIERMERFIQNDLGDARSFSLDSPASRRSRIDALKAMPAAA